MDSQPTCLPWVTRHARTIRGCLPAIQGRVYRLYASEVRIPITHLIAFIASAVLLLNCRPSERTKNVPIIGPGEIVDKELAGSQVEAFQIPLEAGQYMRVVAQQYGIEAKLTILTPDGRAAGEMESPYGIYAIQSVSTVAQKKGSFRIEVHADSDNKTVGRFSLRVEELRMQRPSDISRIQAEQSFVQARKLSSEAGIEQWTGAIDTYKEALLRWREIGDEQGQATTFYCMGLTYLKLANRSDAAKALEQALTLQRRVGYRRGEAYTLNVLGLTHAYLGNQTKSMEYLFQALPLWRAENDKARESTTLNILGGAHDNIGEPQKALDFYQQALEIRRALNDLPGQASTLNNIGVIYDEYGETQKTLECYKQALHLLNSIEHPQHEARESKATTINNIGYMYAELGDQEKALEYYNQALPLRREVNDRNGEAYTLINIGYAYFSLGEAQKALDYYNEALTIRNEIEDNWGKVYTLNYIGQAHASLGQAQRALDYYTQALELLNVVQDRQARASLLDKTGQAYVALGQPQKAIDQFNRALSLWRALSDRRGEATTLLGMARAEAEMGRLSSARGRIEFALKNIEFLRTRIANLDARVFYFAAVQPFYDFYINLLMKMHRKNPSGGFDALALQASERARARVLAEILAESHADIRSGVDQSLLERLHFLEKQINAKTDYQMRLLIKNAPEEQKAAAEKDIRALMDAYQETQAEIRSNSPHYAALTQPHPLSLKDIQRQVLGPDTVMLQYSLGDECSYLWLVSQNSLKTYVIANRQQLEEQAERVYKLLTARQPIEGETAESRQTRIAEADAEYWPQAAKLSQMLIGPVASELESKRLLIVAAGALQYVPVSALPAPLPTTRKSIGLGKRNADNQNPSRLFRPLIVDHEVCILPSASVLAIMRRENAGHKPSPKSVAVFADPVFTKDDPRVQIHQEEQQQGDSQSSVPLDEARALRDFGATRDSFNLPRLLSLRREAEAIVKTQRGETMLALDFDANLARVMSGELTQYRMVHFATHGLINNVHPELSAIVLSLVNQQGEVQNGLLRLHEIYNLQLSADLVVLSACDTGLGKQIRGEGLVGLTRGFMYAGAARVVASLWKVDSLQTEKLMKHFYEGMARDELSPSRALQRAQIEMWKESPQEAPYYWAAFILQGEWR